MVGSDLCLVVWLWVVVMGPGQFFVAWAGSGLPSMVWVWVWKISPKNVKFFIFFPSGSKKISLAGSKSTRVKGGSASYLLRVKINLGLGRVRAHLKWVVWTIFLKKLIRTKKFSIHYLLFAELPGAARVNLQPCEHTFCFVNSFQKCVLQLLGFQASIAQTEKGGIKVTPKPFLDRWGCACKISLRSCRGLDFH